MPVRVAVTQGDTVLYSKLHDVSADIPPGHANAPFSYVDSEINIPRPNRQNIIIYTGFDELRVDVPGAVPASQGLKPIN